MKHDYQKEFRDFLKKSRENVGLTQQKAADRINISIQGFQKWESGESLPSQGYYDAIMETYNLDRKIFFEKLNNAQCPPPEIEEKERKYPWPDCMPLEKWIGNSTLEDLKNLVLDEMETELLGLEKLYNVKGSIQLDTRELHRSINGINPNEEDKYYTPGEFSFSYLPYDYVRTIGAFKVEQLKGRLYKKVHSNKTTEKIIREYFYKNPDSKTFDICNFTENDFLKLSSNIQAVSRKCSCHLNEIIEDAIKILLFLEKNDNKYCIFDGIEPTEIIIVKPDMFHSYLDYKENTIFENDCLYNLYLPKLETKPPYEKETPINKVINKDMCKQIYSLPAALYSDLIEIIEENKANDIEYLKYQKDLEFYEEHKNIPGLSKPIEPPKETFLYIVPTKQGKEFLKWYRETIKNNGGVI